MSHVEERLALHPVWRFKRLVHERLQELAAEFPTHRNREFLEGTLAKNREFSRDLLGFRILSSHTWSAVTLRLGCILWGSRAENPLQTQHEKHAPDESTVRAEDCCLVAGAQSRLGPEPKALAMPVVSCEAP
jgi:hypothetical protein